MQRRTFAIIRLAALLVLCIGLFLWLRPEHIPGGDVQIFDPGALPEKAVKTAESLVAVEFIYSPEAVGLPPNSEKGWRRAIGVVVGDGYVLTCLHAVENQTSLFLPISPTGSRSRIFVIVDGVRFPAMVSAVDFAYDLALLRVFDSAESPKRFSRPVARFNPQYLAEGSRAPLFSFRITPDGDKFFVRHDEFLFYKKIDFDEAFPYPQVVGQLAGTLRRAVVGGFSGSPVVDSEGACRGVVFRLHEKKGFWGSETTTLFIPAQEVVFFLEKAGISR